MDSLSVVAMETVSVAEGCYLWEEGSCKVPVIEELALSQDRCCLVHGDWLMDLEIADLLKMNCLLGK